MIEYGVMLRGHGGCIVPQFKTEEEAVAYGYSRKVGFVVMGQHIVVNNDNTIGVSPWKSIGMGWSVEEAKEYLGILNAKKNTEVVDG